MRIIESHPDKSRRFISQEVCREWGWRQPNGVLKDMVCRSLLLLLESNGFIKLPPRKCTPPNPLANRKKPTRIIDRSDVDIFAYVLMGNHYHILLRTNQANLSKSMQWLALTYTRRFNNRHFRSGHLFQGRFKSIIVQNDAYLMRLSYYIHRNPLRAGIIDRLAEYP